MRNVRVTTLAFSSVLMFMFTMTNFAFGNDKDTILDCSKINALSSTDVRVWRDSKGLYGVSFSTNRARDGVDRIFTGTVMQDLSCQWAKPMSATSPGICSGKNSSNQPASVSFQFVSNDLLRITLTNPDLLSYIQKFNSMAIKTSGTYPVAWIDMPLCVPNI